MADFIVVKSKRMRVPQPPQFYEEPLRLPKRSFDVPTLDQLAKREKLWLLKSFGYGVSHTKKIEAVEAAEKAIGKCRYFTAVKCAAYNSRQNEQRASAIKRHDAFLKREARRQGAERWALRKVHTIRHHQHAPTRKWIEATTGLRVAKYQWAYQPTKEELEWEAPLRSVRAKWDRVDRATARAQEDRRKLVQCYWDEPPRRSIMLLTKLRAIIRALRADPTSVWVPSPWAAPAVKQVKNIKWEVGQPQMAGLGEELILEDQKQNVVLTDTSVGATTVAAEQQFRFDWHQLCTTENVADYSHLTDRHTFDKTVEWTVQHPAGSELTEFRMDLPGDFIDITDGTMPMFVPFKIHRYFKSDILIKIQINTNKFQVGQLQFSWQYLEKYDGNPLDNMYSRSQLPHVLVNAGTADTAELYIPFKYVQPYLFTSRRKDDLEPLYLGTLRCYVVAPLDVPANGPTSCSVTTFISFPNSQFTGLVDGSIAMPQMEAAAAAMVAGAAYNAFIGDRNCDNPSDNVNPNYLVPTATHSWSAGTGLTEKIQSLRLDNSTKGVGRPGIDNSETNIAVPCRTFGMLRSFKWGTQHANVNKSGTLLWSCDVHAQIEKQLCYKQSLPAELDKYSYPPMSVVSGMYKHWRGSIEFRFDVIATQFHTGRLLVAYIPGFYGDASAITLKQARNSACAEFQVTSSTSFTFTVPFISNKAWWPRRYTGPHRYGEQTAPSKLVVFILNPLIPMENVVKEVVIVPYVRAGTDFELSVPVQPSNGLSDLNASKILEDAYTYLEPRSQQVYRVTGQQGFYNSTKYITYTGTDVAGSASTWHRCSRIPKGKFAIYKAQYKDAQPVVTWKKNITSGDNYDERVGYIVLWADKKVLGIPFPFNADGELAAKTVAQYLFEGKDANNIRPFLYDVVKDSLPSKDDYHLLYFDPIILDIPTFEVIGHPNIETRYAAGHEVQPTGSLSSTGFGNLTYNEDFSDLKTLARRYQLYAERNIQITKNYDSRGAIAIFPAIPHGLNLYIDDVNSVFNQCRDGHIPLISSGFMYFRGSLRFRIICATDSMQLGGVKVWVQHHPDGDCRQHEIQIYPNITEEDGFKSHTYGFYIQAMHVNSIIELEIPFYQPGMYGLLRKPSKLALNSKACEYYTLGNLALGLIIGKVDKPFDATLQVYYSIGDDFSFNIFRGFPMVNFTDEVWPALYNKQNKKRDEDWCIGQPEMEEAQPEMMKSMMSYFTKPAVEAATEQSTEAIKHMVDETVNKIKTELSSVKDKFSAWDNITPHVVNAFGNLVHVIANPNIKTMAISIANIIMSFVADGFLKLMQLVDLVKGILTSNWQFFGIIEEQVIGSPEMDGISDNGQYALCGMLFSAVSTMMMYTVAPPAKFPNLLRDVNTGVHYSNNILRFIQNTSEVITYSINYVYAHMFPEKRYATLLEGAGHTIKQWYEEAIYLLDVRNKSKYLYDRSMLARVFDAVVCGNILCSNGIDTKQKAGKLIHDTQRELRKLQTDLFEQGAHPDVRFEPYPIWICGPPGIGKSFLVSSLANSLLKSINFQQPGSLIYYVAAGAKYWSGCNNPAVLVSDDMFQVNDKIPDELANLFTICSSCVCNPPMAAVEEKNRRINPLLYIMCSNSPFPCIKNHIMDENAAYRRRKFLIEAYIDPELSYQYSQENDGAVLQDASQLKKEDRENFAHLKFRFNENPKHVNNDAWSASTDYDDVLYLLTQDFKKHYANERDNFKQRMINMYCLDPDFQEQNLITELPAIADQISLQDQIDAFKTHIADQLLLLEDPQREPEVWEYLRKYGEKVGELPAYCGATYNWLKQKVVDFKFMKQPNLPQMEDEAGTSEFQTPNDKLNPINADELYQQSSYAKELYRNFAERFLPGIKADVFDNDEYSMLEGPFKVLTSELYTDFEICMNEILLKIFNIEGNREKNNWMHDALCELMSAGCLTPLDYLRFILVVGDWHKDIIKFLFRDYIDNNAAVCHSGKRMIVKGDINSIIEEHDPQFYHENKKADARSFLKSITFDQPQEYFLKWNRTCVQTFLKSSCSINYTSSINKYLVVADSNKIQILYAKAEETGSYPDCYALFLAIDELLQGTQLNSYPFINFLNKNLRAAMAALCLGSTLFGWTPMHYTESDWVDHPKCSRYHTFNHIKNNANSYKFCPYQRKLVHKPYGSVITPCDRSQCVYNSKLLYYFTALCARSCETRVNVSFNSYGNETFRRYEIGDIVGALRAEYKLQHLSVLDKFVNWCKHILFHYLPEKISFFYNLIKNRLPTIITGFLFVGSIMALSSGVSYLVDGAANYGQVQSQNYFHVNDPKGKVGVKPHLPQGQFHLPQGNATQKCVLNEKINRNFVIIEVFWIENNQRMRRSCTCLMLRGRAMLLLRHYMEEYLWIKNQGYELEINLVFCKSSKNLAPCRVSITWEELNKQIAWCSIDNKNITSNFGIAILPLYVPMFPDIVRHIAPRNQHESIPSRGDFYGMNNGNEFGIPIKIKNNFMVAATKNTSAVKSDTVYSYNKQMPGLCGSLLVGPTLGDGNGAIIGMHVAGNSKSGDGFAEPMYRETFVRYFDCMFQPIPKEIETKIEQTLGTGFVPLEEAEIQLDSNLLLLGAVPKEMAHKESGKSKIIPSLLHGKIFPVRTEVNPLRPNDPRQPPGSHPLRDGCNKHGAGDVKVFDYELVEEVKKGLSEKLCQVIQPVRAVVRPLSLQQAVCGDINVPYFESIKFKASEGFPLQASRPKGSSDKRWLFRLDEDKEGYKLLGIHASLLSELREREEDFVAANKPVTVYTDCLKDYRLTPSKCAQPGKTRIFSTAPIQSQIDCRKHFQDFCASLKNTKIINGIGIGINPDSMDWSVLVNHLFEVGNRIVTLDYSNYGPCLMSQLVCASVDVIEDWHKWHGASEIHCKRVRWLLENDIVNPVHLAGDLVYQTVNGIASGSPLTGECNSIPNLFYIRLVYMEIMKEHCPTYATNYWFDSHVRIVVYGDDLIMSISHAISDLFNAITIRDYLGKHGITVTSAQKGEELQPWGSLFEATFLKRSFAKHPYRPGVWLAPIEKQSIEECINWVKVSDDPQSALVESCRASLDLAYGHGPEYYQDHRLKLIKACNELGLTLSTKTWAERDNEIFEYGNSSNLTPSQLPWYYRMNECV